MNTSHYPSLELCLRLTEAGFPETEKCWTRSLKWDEESKTFPYELSSRPTPGGYYFAASVMELLDEMPKRIELVNKKIPKGLKGVLTILERDNSSQVSYIYFSNSITKRDYCGVTFMLQSTADSLAQMWLWLKENGYLSIK